MRKTMFMVFGLTFMMMLGIGSVNADSLKTLVIFEQSATTADVSAPVNQTIKINDTVQLQAKLCDINEGTSTVYTKSACTDVDVTWGNGNDAVIKISETGLVTGIGTGSADVIATTINEYEGASGSFSQLQSQGYWFKIEGTYTQGNDTTGSPNSTYTPEEGIVEKDEETGIVEKDVDKDEGVAKDTEIVGKQTSSNPTTGISDLAIYIVPFLLIAGSGIVLKRRMI